MQQLIALSTQWFANRAGKVTYSMASRFGPSSYDCSSAEYNALKAGGFFPADVRIGNTDSLFNDLERNGFTKLEPNAQGNYDNQEGDVFIWGKRGASGGAAGHTGQFADANNIWNCNYGYNGIHFDNYDQLHAWNGSPEQTFYRYTSVAYAPPSIQGSPTDQVLEIGSWIKFTGTYSADDVQEIGGIWQVRSNVLCPNDFTWDDNGIPAEPLVEVDMDGYSTADQDLNLPTSFKLPGKFQVLDLGSQNDTWLALIQWNGLKFWVDVATATEIAESDGGTPIPFQRPQTPPSTPVPDVPPVIQEPPVVPETPVTDTPPTTDPPHQDDSPEPATPPKVPESGGDNHPETLKPPVTNKPKENDMAFTEEQQQELKVASESVQKTIDDVAKSEGVQKIVDGISQKAKVIVYLVGDSLLGLAAVTPQIVVLVSTHDPFVVATTLSSVFATSGLFLLTMFGIYKNGKSGQ